MKINEKKLLFIIYSTIILYFSMQIKNIEQLVCLILLSIIILVLNIFIIKKEKMEVYKKFACIAFVFGMMFIIFIPILHGIDEGAHFFKVYSFFYDA